LGDGGEVVVHELVDDPQEKADVVELDQGKKDDGLVSEEPFDRFAGLQIGVHKDAPLADVSQLHHVADDGRERFRHGVSRKNVVCLAHEK
jgi:hypothetical protein